jgi:hypothetical protein
MWAAVVAEVLDLAAVGTNCIPRKTRANKIDVSFASLRKILFLLHSDQNAQFRFQKLELSNLQVLRFLEGRQVNCVSALVVRDCASQRVAKLL